MSIYDFTPEELAQIEAADKATDKRRRQKAPKSKVYVTKDNNILKVYRAMHNMSQAQLAAKMFVSKGTIEDMERGKTPLTDYVIQWIANHDGEKHG